MSLPKLRLNLVNAAPLRPERAFVLYWMIASRRLHHSFALERAVALAQELGKPLVIFEPLRCDYTWASDRFHRFAIDAMAEHRDALKASPVTYYPYVERAVAQGKGLLAALAAQAAVVVTDEWPCSFMPAMVRAAGARLDVRLEQVDGCGILPLRAFERTFTTAYSFRRAIHKTLPARLDDKPVADPLDRLPKHALPADALAPILARWPAADDLFARDASLKALPIDHRVGPVEARGGEAPARSLLERFLDERLDRYHEERNDVEDSAASGLSPALHWGFISAHQVLWAALDREGWTSDRLDAKPTGQREGWWHTSPGVESFVDELITWRELGFNMAHLQPDAYHSYDSLPDWALTTIAIHADDPRPTLYDRQTLDRAKTHDPIWNAAQAELVTTGTMHNYLRMLWAKKVVEWSASPREALEHLIDLNNRYALDGRDPNSYSGIFWTLGRYDRAWTEREITGKLRYMSSDSTRKKLKLSHYLKRYGDIAKAL